MRIILGMLVVALALAACATEPSQQMSDRVVAKQKLATDTARLAAAREAYRAEQDAARAAVEARRASWEPVAPGSYDALQRTIECMDDRGPACMRWKQEQTDARAAEVRRLRDRKAAAAAAAAAGRTATAKALGRDPGTIRIGDSPEYVRQQWGNPRKIDRMTNSRYGVHEWWWYGDSSNAVHFVDGRVDTIHTSR